MKKTTTTILGILLCINLFGVEINGLNYQLYDNGKATLLEGQSAALSGDLVIPDEVTYDGKTYTVTDIKARAFYKCSLIETLTLPSTADMGFITTTTDGRNSSFGECYKLKAVIVPETNSTLSSQNGVLFNKSKTTIWHYPHAKEAKTYQIPESVTKIASYAFYLNKILESVVFHDGINEIGEYAFGVCTNLKEAEFPTSLKTIPKGMYGACSFTTVTIPDHITNISASAFEHSPNLEKVILGKRVEYIDSWAFSGNSELTEIYSYNPIPPKGNSNWVYDPTYSGATLYVPEILKEAYIATSLWSRFSTIEGIDADGYCKVTATSNEGGTFKINNTNKETTIVIEGESVSLTITPNSGYQIESVTMNEANVTGQLIDGTFTIDEIDEDIAFHISFDIINSIANPSEGEENISVTIQDNLISIGNVYPGENVSLYSLDGVLLQSVMATRENITLATPAKGIYILMFSNHKSIKIAL